MTENLYRTSPILHHSTDLLPQLSLRVHRAAYAVSVSAFLVYCLALLAPAIYEGGYKDGAMVVVPDWEQSGLKCLIFSCLFFPHFFLFAFANVYFIGSTFLHLVSRTRVVVSPKRYWLSAIGPLSALWYGIGRGDKLLVGYYLWVLALTMFFVANVLRSLSSNSSCSVEFTAAPNDRQAG